MNPRCYQSSTDLDKMLSLLQAGRAAGNGTYYVHTGDLRWWLYYPPLTVSRWEHLFLWDDPAAPERILGWALIDPSWNTFDVFTQPELRGSPQAEAMNRWAEEHIVALSRAGEDHKIRRTWIVEEDAVMNGWLQRRGFQWAEPYTYLHLTCPMKTLPPVSPLSDGFIVRSSRGEIEAEGRAAAQYGAFESSAAFDAYVERFRNFMRSPVYNPDCDIVAVAPDGQIGAFCIIWFDALNRVGYFEPVGTHPAYQRKGLGKAVLLEALRRLQEGGMTSAVVCTGEGNIPAIRLYESVGFRIDRRLGLYEKTTDDR